MAVPEVDTAYGLIATTNEDQIVEAQNTDTEAAVRSYFNDIPVMIQIARCESTFRHTLADGTVLKGRVDPADTGVMQINKRYHGDRADKLGLDLEDLDDNLAFARDLYERQGTRPWKASKPCWGGSIAMR